MTTEAPGTTQNEPAPDTGALVATMAVTKHFPGVVALDRLDFELHSGEVHALLGENGAGKSTLTRIIAGDYRPDGGSLLVSGREVVFDSPRDARAAGIRIVTQERTLVPTLSVAENIFLGELPSRARARTVDWSTLRARAREVLERIGLDLSPDQELARLRPAQQQLVEIARAISGWARVLILDEPTAALSGHDAARLFGVVRALRAQGVGILYISHRVGELAEIADRVTVLRDGRSVFAAPLSETTPETLVRAMVGRSVGSIYPTRATAPGETILELSDVSVAGICEGISLDVRHGEIVGVFGLVGSGATEIPYAAAGDLQSSGTIKRGPRVGLIPADRRAEGIFPKGTLQRNIGAASMGRFMRQMVFRRRLERAAAVRQIGALRIKPPNPVAMIAGVSGGNQQKATVGRWLERGTDLLLLSEPTRGVDMGARAEIYEIFGTLCEAGTGILLASSDIDEVAGLCDRAYVMVRGRMTVELRGPDLTVERLLGGGDPVIRREAMTLIRHPSAYLAVLVVAVVVVFSVLSPQFGTADNYVILASGSVSLAIFALGVTIALAAGGADFSIAGNAALAGVIAGLVGASLGPEVGFVVAIACGIGIGAAIGLVISRYNLNTFLVTLAMAGSLRGMAFVLSGSSSGFFIDSGPALSLGQGSTLGIPNTLLVLVVAILASVLLLEHSSIGRAFLATGGNPEAARLVGIRTKSIITLAYAVSGGAAALAGLLLAGRAGVAIPQAATGSELLVFTAVLLGGNRLSGGRSSISGSILAVILVNALYTGFVLLKVSPYLQTIIQGALLILAVLVSRLQADTRASLLRIRRQSDPQAPPTSS